MKRRPGGWGWIGLAAYVGIWDAFAGETLSGAFGRAVEHPVKRWLVTLGVALTVAHLYKTLPDSADPFHHIGRLIRRDM